MTKKRIAVVFSLLVSLMCTSMMTGCSNETKKDDGENAADNSTSSTDESADGEKTVVTMSMWDAINEEYNFVEEFNNSQNEIELQIISIPENYSEKLNAMIVSDTAPDIILSWECDILRFIQDDVVIPLDEYVENSDLADEQMVPAVQKFSDMTGGTYSLPWCYAGECLFYNKDLKLPTPIRCVEP
ncbi:MAG: extracellular solute-binding protein [Clostridiales bacterium]|nr:extracellular solute-binding protein [Clostridiales bacterium]